MALSKFENDMSIVRKQPNQVVFQADKLKELFDKAGEDIKTYLNEILTEEIDAKFTSDNEYVNEEILKIYASMEQKIAELVDSSPEALNTLNELASALGNDPNFATTVLNKLSQKLEISTYNQDKELQNIVNNSKVDKVEGKELSSNDFTDNEKDKLSKLPTYEQYNSKIAEINKDINTKADKADTYTKDEVDKIKITVDEELDDTSENPVQNKVVTERFKEVDWNINENTNMINVLTEEFRGYTSDYGERIQSNEDNIQTIDTRVGDLERFIGDEYILNGYSLKQIIGDIHAALDELHNYAQGLIGGAE